ncbi:hypothetical protein U737_07620 [Methylomonas sp. LW13]|uniref:hypothetical protein n=1 Tax=unclassified Methylomonas TaxID=2608980 RepID=UPI00051B2F65|nr:hypothetical protein [Methylomonas sp. LW13]QBC26781.1 hypothetical protein U737_07620 [Methylomonas sp. LW13]
MEEQIKIRLTGEGISPGLVRSRELAEILESVEDMMVSESLRKDPTIKKDDIIIGLCRIEDKSIGLIFNATLTSIVIPAFISTSIAIEEGNFDTLTPQTIRSLEVISNFSKKHNCDAEFSSSKSNLIITKITPQTEIPKPKVIVGNTEITGKILRVGGKKPRAMLELMDGSVLYCDVQENMAQELGHRLYKTALFSGVATWNIRDLEIEEFQIMEFEEIQQVPVNKMLKELSKEIGYYFKDIEDVSAFVSTLRRDGGME